MIRLPKCQRVRHGLSPCEAIATLKSELAAAQAMNLKLAERILAAHNVLANLAEKKDVLCDRCHPPAR